ncbi:MAG: EF-hand domain-containing protein [Polaromonas sp.]|uniref:EF-hand domain-containing protein n=1 Tax=Polaromonas sp. TaxID=1869339 RepID=UPI002487CCD0|nr:EF-hand domain-containing protein [Polaromonas sp.]MDI1236929.1 EF-hand domain-containing protein [Polaromonas sp.]
MTLTSASQGTWRTPARALFALASATALLTPLAHAQPAATAPAVPPSVQAQAAPASSVVSTASAAVQPRYSAADIERAFSFMDTNKDGKISREEASGFRGVARHFDEADTNKDSTLSHQEFESALNQAKSR